jgi:uncharacterized membrane protein
MVKRLSRILRHLLTPPWRVAQRFPTRVMQNIAHTIRTCEAGHRGEIRFAVEAALSLPALVRGQSAHARALEVFSQLGIWDTEHNNGVLIYLLLADHDVEIVADRGIHRHVGREDWESICRDMEQAFREQRYEQGIVRGIEAVSSHLGRHYPGGGDGDHNELPDQPVVL